VRLWDLRTPTCQAVLNTPAPPVAAFDEQGLVFAVGVDSGVLKLYDAAQYSKGPFQTFVVGPVGSSGARGSLGRGSFLICFPFPTGPRLLRRPRPGVVLQ
jgi:hypothetical protein